jgi:energy-coupling factor transport system permease protein
MIALLLCVLTATLSPSLQYECVLVFLAAVFGCVSGKIRYSLTGAAFFAAFYGFTVYYLSAGAGMAHTMFVAWMGLFYKVFPCGMLGGVILSTTKVNEFMSAMNKAHVSKRIVIPLAVMLRYIPTIREDWRYIKDAMRLRDVSPSLKGLLTNPGMTAECVYVPLMMTASKAADELSIASVTRGIENPNPRTCLVQIKIRFGDALAVLCFSALFIAGRFL